MGNNYTREGSSRKKKLRCKNWIKSYRKNENGLVIFLVCFIAYGKGKYLKKEMKKWVKRMFFLNLLWKIKKYRLFFCRNINLNYRIFKCSLSEKKSRRISICSVCKWPFSSNVVEERNYLYFNCKFRKNLMSCMFT